MITVKISEDFTKTPGGRFIKDGEYSGEQFRNDILIPKYEEALSEGKKLFVDLDGCYGMPTSFLEEAFGGIVRIKGNKKIKDILKIKTEDRPDLEEKIWSYIDAVEVK